MAKLHEILAAEKTVVSASVALMAETADKFRKDAMFIGEERSLKMLDESAANTSLEQAARTSRPLTTTVYDTLEYALGFWAKAESLLYAKNLSNTKAVVPLKFRNITLAEEVPVDELLGLEARLTAMKQVLVAMPTLDASKNWKHQDTDPNGVWTAAEERTTKTEKVMIPVVLYEATDKHPAQVKEATRDEVVGTFTRVLKCGAATSLQKANVLALVDELIAEVKKARVQANNVDVVPQIDDLGRNIAKLILGQLA